MIQLKIGPVKVSIEGLEVNQLPKNTLLFLCNSECSDIHYCIKMGNPFSSFPKTILYKRNDIVVFHKENNLESRLLLLPGERVPYAYYDEIDESHVAISFNPNFTDLLNVDTIFYSLLALERHLSRIHAFVFHCAYMDFDGKAILFSGPSGMGKSTHSNLWCKVFPQRARVLNGDKCLLIKENNKFYALGWPICGSSGICNNEKREVESIILLQQSMINQEVPEKPIQKFKRILEQLAVNYWNSNSVNSAMFFVESLLGSVHCCTYTCNMEYEAVTTLYNLLYTKHEKN